MSVSGVPAGPGYGIDPRDIHLSQLNASRLSQLSTESAASAVTLGGVDYPVGSRVGKTGAFVIGDPGMFDPHNHSARSSQSTLGANSSKGLVHATPIEEKGYDFEDWNWPVIRLSCLVLLCAVMIALLAAVIGICVQHSKKCASPFEWYEGSTVYTIDIPYFADADENGIGDIAGLRDKLDYLELLETKVISLSKFLPSVPPYWDTYTSFQNVDTRLGTLGDLGGFIKAAHDESDAKVILEFSPVWTSVEHTWFTGSTQDSSSNPSPFADFYIWRNQPDSHIRGSWENNAFRSMYYLHPNDTTKAMLNWDSAMLREKFVEELKFWLEQGVDGFVMRDMDKMYASDHGIIKTVLEGWREICEKYSSENEHKILALEDKYLDKVSRENLGMLDPMLSLIDLVIVPVVMGANDTYTLQHAMKRGRRYTGKVGGPWSCWEVMGLMGVQDKYATSVQLYTLMMPGTPMLTAGQEVGRYFREMTFSSIDPFTPILWHSDGIYPYSPGKELDKVTINSLKTLISHRNTHHSLRQDSIHSEDEDITDKEWNAVILHINGDTLLLERSYKRKKAYYYIANFHTADTNSDLSFISAYGDMVTDTSDQYTGEINLQEVDLIKGQGVVFSITK